MGWSGRCLGGRRQILGGDGSMKDNMFTVYFTFSKVPGY